MSTKILIGVVVGAVLVGGGYFALLKSNAHKGDESAMQNSEAANQNGGEQSGKKVAFSEFVKHGGSYKCEVKQSMSDMDNGGTVYVNGGNMRGDFSTIAEGRTMQTSFIMKDGYTYNWSSMAPNMGVKMKMATKAEADANLEAQGTYSWSADQVGDYNCEAWTADQSKFELPTNVTFRAIGSTQ